MLAIRLFVPLLFRLEPLTPMKDTTELTDRDFLNPPSMMGRARKCTVADAIAGDEGASLGPIHRLPGDWPEDNNGSQHWALNIGGFIAANNMQEAAEKWAKSENWEIIA